MSTKKKASTEPELVLAHQFWLTGKNKAKLEKLSNKILDTLFKKHGKDIGVMIGQFVPEGAQEANAAERALERLGAPAPVPMGRNQSYSHGYQSALSHARRVIREELTKHHGL